MKSAAYTQFVLLLAAAGGHWPLCLHGGHPPPADANVAALLESVDSGERQVKLDALAQLMRAAIDENLGEQKGAAIKRCAQLLQGSDDELAEAACEVLSWLDADAAERLVAALQSDDPYAQSRAARAVSSIASRKPAERDKLDVAIPHLAKLLDGRSKAARHNAFYAIAALGPRAIPTMIDALDAEDYFITVMTEGFVRDGAKSVEPLCEALQADDVKIRRNAALVLFAISWRAPDALPVLENKGLAPLTAAIDDDDPLVRSRAIETLGRMEGRAKPSLDAILAALKRPDAPLLSIADAAGRIGPEAKHLDVLLDGVADVDATWDRERIVGKFAQAIGAVGEEGVERITVALDDRREIVSETAMRALYHLGPQAAPAVPAVIRKLNEKDRWAAHVLGAIGPQAKAAVPHLVRRLADDEWAAPRISTLIMHRSDSAQALAAIGAPALPALLAGLKHDNALVRAGCLVALEDMPPKVMVPLSAIEPLTRDAHPVIHTYAMLALIQHGEAMDYEPILKQLSKDSSPAVARTARQQLDNLNQGEK